MHRYLFIITILVCTSLQASVVNQLQQHSAKIASVSGTFEQTRKIAVLPLPLTSNGHFSYHRDQGLIWETLHPVKNTLKLPGESSTTNTTLDQHSFISKLILGVLSGNFRNLEDQFTIKQQEQQHWQLLLTPKNKDIANHLQQVELQGTDFTEQITITETNGDISRITFKVTAFVNTDQ